MREEIKKTPLHDWHTAHGANMVDFGRWDMPLWYPSGARNEHMAVITNAGLFDTSHMAVIMITGPDSFDLLQLCFTKDLRACVGKDGAPLSPGKCTYGAYLNKNGELIDDAIVYQLDSDVYMTVVNSNMGEKIAGHLTAHRGERKVEVADHSGRVGKIDLQGPESARIMMKILEKPESVLKNLSYFSFRGHSDGESPFADTLLTDGTCILLSRTGYTGEFGFEIFAEPDQIVDVWNTLLGAGEEFGLIPCGLAARDSLRVGAMLPLSHQDIGPWPFINHPWPFALPYNDDRTGFTKKFIGDVIFRLRDKAEHTRAFAGFDPRKVSVHDPAVVLDSEGNEIGVVLTCVADLAIGRKDDTIYSIAGQDKPKGFKPRGLCCGFVLVRSKLDAGQIVELKDNRRKIKVMIVDDVRPDRTARRPIKEFM